MKRKYLKETTSNWKTDFRVPAHTYIFEGSATTKIVGYIKEDTTEEIIFKKPQNFDKRNRTFKTV